MGEGMEGVMVAWVITVAMGRATVAMERASEVLEGVMVAWATMEALERATVALERATVALDTATVALGTATAVTTMATAAMTMATVATTMATVATTRATVATRAMEVLEDMERVTEDLEGMEGLDFHLTASEEDMEGLDVHLMALEEVMVELAPTPMAVQVPYMECQDMGGRGDTTHRLQPMVPILLLVIHNLLLMMHLLLHNHLQPMQVLQLVLPQVRLMTHLPRPMRPLPTIFLLAMVFDLPQTNLGSNSLVPSSNLEPTNSLLHRLLLAQCDM